MRTIASNAGVEGAVIVGKVRVGGDACGESWVVVHLVSHRCMW